MHIFVRKDLTQNPRCQESGWPGYLAGDDLAEDREIVCINSDAPVIAIDMPRILGGDDVGRGAMAQYPLEHTNFVVADVV